MKKKQILVIGDQCTDEFVYGECKRLSPEAPVPVFTPITTVRNGGMAFNVAANLEVLAKDYEIYLKAQLEPITKTRYVDLKSNHMFLRVDQEGEVRPFVFDEELKQKIQDFNAVVVSDYDKGFLTAEIIREIGKLAKFCVIDTKKILPADILSEYNFIKFNQSEFDKNAITDPNILNKVIITLGSGGAKYRETFYPNPTPKETIDVSGAGDTFLAAFTYQYLNTLDVPFAIRYANEKAAIVVSKKGVALP